MYRAILFDNDGVLVDTERLYFAATRQALAGIGVVLDPTTYVELFLRQGVGAWHLAEAQGLSEKSVAALRAERDRLYVEMVGSAEIVIPGVAEILPELAKCYRMAIVTSSRPEPFARTHARTGLLPYFERVLTRVDYGKSKPEPEPYLRAMELLELSAAECLVIEDSERGLRAAKAAGIDCWVVPSSLTAGERFAEADAVFDSLRTAAARLLS